MVIFKASLLAKEREFEILLGVLILRRIWDVIRGSNFKPNGREYSVIPKNVDSAF